MKFPKSRPWRSDVYLDFVRGFACCAPGCSARPPSEAHHWDPTDTAIGRKVSDCFTVPLCTRCHRHFHDTGTLPGHSHDETRTVFVAAQRSILGMWVKGDKGGRRGPEEEDPF